MSSHELVISQNQIESRIFTIRGLQVMIDFHIADLYQVDTKRLNEQVRRNKQRFPERFMFQLSNEEWDVLKSQFATSSWGGRRKIPFAFTEQGVAMLSSVLNSETAVEASIMIMDAFISMRKLLLENYSLFQRLDRIELKQLETDKQIEKVFKALDRKTDVKSQGVFFDGQIFDAYQLVSKVIRSAKKSIVLIDNYIDETTITILSKKGAHIKALILTRTISKQLRLDIDKANQQYGNFELKEFNKSHDRFLIIDDLEIYHIGASLKDLGRKWFAFSKMDKNSVENIVKTIQKI